MLAETKSHASEDKVLFFHVNGSCNNDCMFCSAGGNCPELDANAKEVIRRIDALHLEKRTTITLSGGEPTEHAEISKIIRYLKKKGHKIKMLTNGRRLSDFDFAKKLVDAGLEEILTEIHSTFPEVHDFLTQRQGSFNETISGIKNISKLGQRVKIKIILNRVTCKNVPEIVEFVCNNIPEATEIMITPLLFQGSAISNKDLIGVRFSDAAPYVEKAIDVACDHKMRAILDMFPICALNQKYHQYSVERVPHRFYKEGRCHYWKKTFAGVCSNCEKMVECPGVYMSHIIAFGEEELKPIRFKKTPHPVFDEAPAKDRSPLNRANKILAIGVNGSCNNDCMFCSTGGSRPEWDLSAEEVIRRIESQKLEREATIILTGGEPTEHKDIAGIIACLRKKSYKIMMVTNARRFFDVMFSEKIASSGLGAVITEIHSPFPEVHDFLTQRPGSFSETAAGIKNLIKFKVQVNVKIILNRLNYKTLPQIIELVCKNMPEVRGISITDTDIAGSALINKALLGIRFSDAAPYIESGIDVAKRFKMNVELYAFPVCAIHKEYRQYSVSRTQCNYYDSDNCLKITEKKYLADACKPCGHKDECSGIWQSHIDMFGEGELKPILKGGVGVN